MSAKWPIKDGASPSPGCYSLDVFCASPTHPVNYLRGDLVAQLTGTSKKDVERKARALGHRHVGNNYWYCATCVASPHQGEPE